MSDDRRKPMTPEQKALWDEFLKCAIRDPSPFDIPRQHVTDGTPCWCGPSDFDGVTIHAKRARA